MHFFTRSSGGPSAWSGQSRTLRTSKLRTSQYNVDGVFIKNFSFGTKQAQLKIEMLNLFNRPNVRALSGRNNISNSNFGQTGVQAGFTRITQVMFRYSF